MRVVAGQYGGALVHLDVADRNIGARERRMSPRLHIFRLKKEYQWGRMPIYLDSGRLSLLNPGSRSLDLRRT